MILLLVTGANEIHTIVRPQSKTHVIVLHEDGLIINQST